MKVLVHITLFALLFSLYAKLHICLKYVAYQTYYAEVLCENKNVEESCCKGKCAMEKELINVTEKEEDKTQNQAPVLKIAKTEEALCSSIKLINFKGLTSVIHSPYTKKECVGINFKTNKPPCV